MDVSLPPATAVAGAGRCRRRRRQRHRRARYPRQRNRRCRPGYHRVTIQPGVRRHRGRDLGRPRLRALAARSEARFAVNNVARVHRLRDEWVDRERRAVEIERPQPGTQKQRAQLARFDGGDALDGLVCRAAGDGQRNKHARPRRIREVHQPEPAHNSSGVGVVVVEEVGERVRRAVQDVLQSHVLIDDRLEGIAQSGNLLAGLVAGFGDESLHLAHCRRQIGQRRVQVGFAVVDHAGQGGQPVVELHDLDVAVAKCGDEGLQILDDVDDVAAAVGEDPPHP